MTTPVPWASARGATPRAARSAKKTGLVLMPDRGERASWRQQREGQRVLGRSRNRERTGNRAEGPSQHDVDGVLTARVLRQIGPRQREGRVVHDGGIGRDDMDV